MNLELIEFVPPPLTQPVLALGLSLRGWVLKPLSLELICGPTRSPFPSLFPLANLGFFDGVYRSFKHDN